LEKFQTLTLTSIDSFGDPYLKEDEGDSLWAVFNRVQESIINGGYSAALRGAKVRKVKKIKSFERDIQVNQDLYQISNSLS